MGDFGAGTAAQVAGGAILSGASRAFRWLRLAGLYEASWLQLGEDSDVSLTAEQTTDIERFLASSGTRVVLNLLVVTTLSPDSSEQKAAIAVIGRTFRDAAERWLVDSKGGWKQAIEAVWGRVQEVISDSFSNVSSALFDTQEAQYFSRFLATSLGYRYAATHTSDYFRRATQLASDFDRLMTTADAFDALQLGLRGRKPPPIMTHTETDVSAEFMRLYIQRTLYGDDGQPYDSQELMGDGAPYRIVLTGAPGAGKTTFVAHLSYALSQSADAPQVSLTVKSRDYLREGWASSLVDYLGSDLRARFDCNVTSQNLRDLLLLGRVSVVVDGLDEVADINKRAELVQRIEGLCQAYPAVSILVTSREVGYDRAPLSRTLFERHRLIEFTTQQVEEYSRRWFELIERPDLIEAFTAESQTVQDLRRNPLLLSLLCILYRARGAIPRKRRDIYTRCADLLFVTWDTHRGISQPEDMPAYGQRIMQEIARWVYKSKAAQAGLEERVITKAIATYLSNVAGISEDEARRRAADFLDFCAGRAWLLGKIGTNEYGERVFGFTHRTFLEYFTAEAISRAADGSQAVAETVAQAYKSDPTSVLPELLIQAYDEKEDGGGRQVFEEVCRTSGMSSGLPMRLMDGVLLPKRSRALAFDMLCDQWRTSGRYNLETFASLLSLNPDARGQFIEDYLKNNADAQRLFVHGWASIELAGQASWFDSDWNAVVERLAADPAILQAEEDAVVNNWLFLSDSEMAIDTMTAAELLAVKGRFGSHLGSLWWVLESDVTGKPPTTVRSAIVINQWLLALQSGYSVYSETVKLFSQLVESRMTDSRLADRRWKFSSDLTSLSMLGAVMAIDESWNHMPPQLLGLASEACGIDIKKLIDVRNLAIESGESDEPIAALPDETVDALRALPDWCMRWTMGVHKLVLADRRDMSEEDEEEEDWVLSYRRRNRRQ
jgi:KaiC/GvpD/RAD55 family RecA-like ATPase